MNKAYLLIGGNMGDRLRNLAWAAELLQVNTGEVIQSSGVYETAAWGKTDQPAFLNQALLLQTDLSAEQLLQKIMYTENAMGRTRSQKYGPRTIDIDILFYNREIIQLPQLIIPHPEIQNRRFALEPMNEIAPDFIHPVLNKSISQLLAECPDKLDVRRLV
jgi:2-amino-4-hydroxy-6-hydroxymethyldihydropteridine diphosphokinase